VIGPPRTGTSWLYTVLGKRTNLPGSTKETRFYDVHFHRGVKWYQAHYPVTAAGLRMGEVAPTYFGSALARERIAKTVPQAAVVCTFRDPVERVLSLYRVKRAYGHIPWSFEQAILRDPELTNSSKYATHLSEWQSTFGRDRVLAMVYDDLRDDPQSFVDALADFIGVVRFDLTPVELERVYASGGLTLPRSYYRTHSATAMANWLKARRLHGIVSTVKKSRFLKLFLGGGPAFAELSLEFASKLYEQFRPEVERLETLINRDLSAWKTLRSRLNLNISEIG